MSSMYLLGIAIGMIGALTLNIGKGIQKQKVHIFLLGKEFFAHKYRWDRRIWIIGLLMTGSSMITYSIALKLSESPSTISAMTGIGLIGLTIYALKILKEKLTATDGVAIAIIIIGTSVLGYLGASGKQAGNVFQDAILVRTIVSICILGLIACIAAWMLKKFHGVVFGLTAGALIGTAIFLGDAALVKAGGSLSGQFSNPYPYIAFLFGNAALITTNLGFIRGRALEVVPAVNSATIVTPLVFEYTVYGNLPGGINISLIALILVGVILLSMGAAAKVSDAGNQEIPAQSVTE